MKQLKKFIKKELRYGAHNYKSLPVVIKEAKGIYMYDINEIFCSPSLYGF